MIIGLDFDNTIVNYDGVFYAVAREQGVIGDDVVGSKLSVRDNLRSRDMEDVWTEMQGYVYGACMHRAELYPGVRECLAMVRDKGLKAVIISHKTRYPYVGGKYDLHKAARGFIEGVLNADDGPLIAPEDVFFLETKGEKIQKIVSMGCGLYLDDLPEILLADELSLNVNRYLFDPVSKYGSIENVTSVSSWSDFAGIVGRL